MRHKPQIRAMELDPGDVTLVYDFAVFLQVYHARVLERVDSFKTVHLIFQYAIVNNELTILCGS